jgi:hypothetical protein
MAKGQNQETILKRNAKYLSRLSPEELKERDKETEARLHRPKRKP